MNGFILVLSLVLVIALVGLVPIAWVVRRSRRAPTVAPASPVQAPRPPDPVPARPRKPDSFALLTARELEIARLVELGKRNAEIARELSLSHYTVETHLKHIYSKLGVRGRMQLARWMRDGRAE